MADSTPGNNMFSDFQFIAGSIILASLAVILFVLFNRKPQDSEEQSKNGNSTAMPDRPPLPVDVRSYYKNEKESYSCQISLSEARNLEEQTRDQWRSSLWKKERSMRLTASNFGAIIKRRKKVNDKFLDRLRGSHRPFNTKYTRMGADNEACVIEKYSLAKSVKVFPVGFCVNPGLPFLGATPDGLVYDSDTGEYGLLEIKTLSKAKEMNWSVSQAIDNAKKTKCCLKRSKGQISLDHNHDYFYQVQGQLGVIGLTWCDFYVDAWHDFYCERIIFDEDFFASMVKKLSTFYLLHFCEET